MTISAELEDEIGRDAQSVGVLRPDCGKNCAELLQSPKTNIGGIRR